MICGDAVKVQIEKFQQDILVEQFISGREFAVGINGKSAQHVDILPIVEINLDDPRSDTNLGSDKKKKGGVGKTCPAKLSQKRKQKR